MLQKLLHNTQTNALLLVIVQCFLSEITVLAQGASNKPDPPSITIQRYTEDYSYLQDLANRSGAWWEPLKYIPLDKDNGSYLTVGGTLYLQHQRDWNNYFQAANQNNYWITAAMAYTDWHIGSYLRIFGQFQAILNRIPGLEQTGVDLLQGFGEVKIPLGREGHALLRGGRQILSYGSGRLISTGTPPRSFDGILGQVEVGDWRADIFYMRPGVIDMQWFRLSRDYSRKLWSVYTSLALPRLGSDGAFDVFYIGYENDSAMFSQVGGRELRHTFGTRFAGSAGSWHWDLEGSVQTGTFSGIPIRAWALASEGSYTITPANHTITLQANIISGDTETGDDVLGTYNVMFYSESYFGEAGQIGPVNLINLRPIINFNLGSGWLLETSAVFYWRQSLEDGVYGPSFTLGRPAGESRARYIGTQTDLALMWRKRGVNLSIAYSVLWPGRFIEETGSAETVYVFVPMITLSL